MIAAWSQTSVATPKTITSDGIERLEHRVRIRVGEHVEALLQQQQLAAAAIELADEAGRVGDVRERQRVGLRRLGDLLRAARATEAMGRIRAHEVGRRRRSRGR